MERCLPILADLKNRPKNLRKGCHNSALFKFDRQVGVEGEGDAPVLVPIHDRGSQRPDVCACTYNQQDY